MFLTYGAIFQFCQNFQLSANFTINGLLKPLALVLDHLTEHHKLESSLSQVYQVDSDDRFVIDLS